MPAEFNVLKASRGEHPWREPAEGPDTSDTPEALMARDNTVYAVVVGSRLFGTNLDDQADYDELAICIEPPARVFNTHFHDFKRIRRSRDDHDRTTYGLRHFVSLAAKGDPFVLPMLYAPNSPEYVLAATDLGNELIENRYRFLSRRLVNSHLGFINSMDTRYLSTHSTRKDLVAHYGYDTKAATHTLRVAYQAVELLTKGRITLPLPAEDRELMISIRLGEISKEQVMAMIARRVATIERVAAHTSLPERPDHEALNAWVGSLYRRHWDAHVPPDVIDLDTL